MSRQPATPTPERFVPTRLSLNTAPDSAFEPLEARRLLAADLEVSFESLSVPFDWLVPGDKVRASVIVENVGDEPAFGDFDLLVGAAGVTDDSTTEVFGSRRYFLDLLPGSFAVYRNITITVGSEFEPGVYNFFAEAAIPSDSDFPIDDADVDNNIIYSQQDTELVYRFGTFFGDDARSTRRNVKLSSVVEEQNLDTGAITLQTITYTLSGGGYGQVVLSDDDNEPPATLVLADTGPSSAFSIAVKGGSGGNTFSGPIQVNGSLKSFRGPTLDLFDADISIAGTISDFLVRDISSSQLDIASGGTPTRFTARNIDNFAFISDSPLASFKASNWSVADPTPTDDDDTLRTDDYLSAPYVSTLTIANNFETDLFLDGSNAPRANTLGKTSIRGDTTGFWVVNGNATGITIGSASADFEASFNGTLTSFTTLRGFDGAISALTIGKLDFRGDLFGAGISSGFFLGDDLSFGGEGGESDNVPESLLFGSIASLSIKGNVTDSLISAGLYSPDGESFEFTFGQAAAIRKITITGEFSNSEFYGQVFPRTVKIGAETLIPADNPDIFYTSVS